MHSFQQKDGDESSSSKTEVAAHGGGPLVSMLAPTPVSTDLNSPVVT